MRSIIGLGIFTIAVTGAWGQAAARTAQDRVIALPQRSYLGIGVAEITSERAKALGLKEERGAEVTSVAENSPAAKAGLKTGDVVLEYNGTAVQGTEQLTRLVQETPAGRAVKIVVWRNGGNQTLTATVGDASRRVANLYGFSQPWPSPQIAAPRIVIPDVPQMQMTWQSRMLGILGESLGEYPQLGDYFGAKEGVLVKSVTANSAAEKAGMKAGDVIVRIDDSKITDTEGIRRALARDNKNTFTVTVVRNHKEMPLTVTVEDNSNSRGMRVLGRSSRPVRVYARPERLIYSFRPMME